MNTRIFSISSLMAFSLCLIAALTLFPNEPRAQNSGTDNTQAVTSPGLTQVESKYVCMVTNELNAKEQIPVVVDGKTYYGCCHMCEAKLKEDPASRMATDPVSGRQVDKSTAVIGAAPGGKVYYFESAEDLKAFNSSPNQ